MNRVTLKQLRYFEAVARFGHFGHAARDCAVSQPALSVQIRDLEADLGIALFERGPKQVTLTAFGAEFAPRARAILQSVDELGDLARAAQGPLAGVLRLGVIPTIAPYALPVLLSRLSQSHPKLELRVRETITPRLLDELREGRLDAVIVALPVAENWARTAFLGSEDFLLVRPQSQADQPPPHVSALRADEMLLLEEGHCLRDQVLDFCNLAARRQQGQSALDSTSLSTLVQMVSAGMGVTLVPAMAAPVETRRATVEAVRFAGVAPGRELGLVWRASTPLHGQLHALADVLRDALGLDQTGMNGPVCA